MDCRTVMAPIPESLYADEPAGRAIDFMIRKHIGLLPVVDREDRFMGMISGDRLMHFMLPRTLMMMRGAKRMGYLRESVTEYQKRLDALRERPLGELLERNVETVHPDASLADAVKKISQKQFVVPVVDDDGRLLGAISFFTVLHWLTDSDGEDIA